MSCYISSNNNRFYAALESAYGAVPAIIGTNRIPALKLRAKQVPEQTGRRDKTGSRTFAGLPNSIRKRTNYEVDTLLTEWTTQPAGPAYGPLFQAAMGGTPLYFAGGTVASVTGGTQIQFAAAHGLTSGQAITSGGEIRFVTAIQDTVRVFVNAPFATQPTAGAAIGSTMTYGMAASLPSVAFSITGIRARWCRGFSMVRRST